MPALLSLLLLCLTAWSSRAQAEDEIPELKIWHAYRGDERAALEGLIAQWGTLHPEIRPVPLALPYDSFVSKLESAAPRGNGPDLFIAAHERVGQWATNGLVAPFADLPPGLHPATVEALTYEGQRYGLPLAYKCLALFYNRALISTPPTDTHALDVFSKVFLAAHPGSFPLAWQATEPYFHAPWMHGFGGGVFVDGAVQLDQPGNAASMAWLAGLFERGTLPREPTGALVTQLFNEGLAAMVVNGPWFIGEIDPAVDFGVAALPMITETGAPAAPYLTVEGAMVSAYAKHPDEARALARYLVFPDAARTRALEGHQAVATMAVYQDPDVAADPVLTAFRHQLDATVPLPNKPEMASTWEPLARALRKVTRGALSAEDALRAAQREYLVVTRPPPPEANPTPYLVFAGLLVVGGLAWVGRGALREKARIRELLFAYAYVGPAALAMILLVVVPFVVGATVSLFAHRDGQFTFVGLANFVNIVLARDWAPTDPLSFYYTLVVTVGWTVANVVLHVSIGLALAMLLREPWLRLRGIYRVLLIIPWAVPNYITALIWKGMFNRQFGAINGLLVWLGAEPVSWFSQFSTAFTANLVTNTWLGFPFMMVVTLGALQSIPRDLEQAAEVDGANGWQRFRHITLPLLRPALLPAVILGSVWTFNMFNIIYLVSAGEPDGGTEILISEAYRWAFTRQQRYGYASAYAVLIFIVLLVYSRAANRIAGQKVL